MGKLDEDRSGIVNNANAYDTKAVLHVIKCAYRAKEFLAYGVEPPEFLPMKHAETNGHARRKTEVASA